MNQPIGTSSLIERFPEDVRKAADLLKQAVPHMVRHDLPPNPVQYALWYSYCQGQMPELNRRLDKITHELPGFPPEVAIRLFREFIIRGELEAERAGQQQVLDLVGDVQQGVSCNIQSSQNYTNSLILGLAALQEPVVDDLPSVLHELQQSTQQMQDQQLQFMQRLQRAQNEIVQLRSQLERAQAAANLDSLTQVFNRNAFTRLLNQALTGNPQGLVLIMLDIDHFKQFNDQYGHPLGDRVLQHVGQLLRDNLPANALVARYGGEEFCLVMRDCFELQSALDFAELLRHKLMGLRIKVRSTDQVLSTITASFGLAQALPGDNFDSLVTRADDALYQAKHNGRNQICVASAVPAA